MCSHCHNKFQLFEFSTHRCSQMKGGYLSRNIETPAKRLKMKSGNGNGGTEGNGWGRRKRKITDLIELGGCN